MTLVSSGSLHQTRAFHTATLLQNGSVLIAGGEDDTDTYLATAELYDPGTGLITQTGPMSTARMSGTATLLTDGRVLMAGGQDVSGKALATAELFDPKTGKFTSTGSMTTPRFNAAAVVLADGQVLVVGGNDGPNRLDTVERYDPRSGKFSSAGRMSVPRENPAAAVLGAKQAGKVIVAGGGDQSGYPEDTSEIYDPVSGVFSLPQNLGRTSKDATACLLPDGNVLLVGGFDYSGMSDSSTLEYSVNLDAWTPNVTIEAGGTAAAVAPMQDGSILMVESVSGVDSDLIDVYDPTAARVDYVGSLAQDRTGLTATQLKDGSVLFVGGRSYWTASNTVELYTFSR
jgi:hypothetical protein